jgi:hypothetical protein
MSSRYELLQLQPQRARTSGSENRTTERPGHRAYSGGCRDRRTPRMEKISPTAAPRAKATGPNGNPLVWGKTNYSGTGNPPKDDQK